MKDTSIIKSYQYSLHGLKKSGKCCGRSLDIILASPKVYFKIPYLIVVLTQIGFYITDGTSRTLPWLLTAAFVYELYLLVCSRICGKCTDLSYRGYLCDIPQDDVAVYQKKHGGA